MVCLPGPFQFGLALLPVASERSGGCPHICLGVFWLISNISVSHGYGLIKSDMLSFLIRDGGTEETTQENMDDRHGAGSG